jgi:hypothetical protein
LNKKVKPGKRIVKIQTYSYEVHAERSKENPKKKDNMELMSSQNSGHL